jgi:hypothetical protein
MTLTSKASAALKPVCSRMQVIESAMEAPRKYTTTGVSSSAAGSSP